MEETEKAVPVQFEWGLPSLERNCQERLGGVKCLGHTCKRLGGERQTKPEGCLQPSVSRCFHAEVHAFNRQ